MRSLWKLIFWGLYCALMLFASATAQTLTWKDINGTSGFSWLAEGANGRLFGLQEHGVYFSDDDGVNWSPTSLIAGKWWSYLVSNGNQVLTYFYNSSGLVGYQAALSTDNGDSWTRILREGAYESYDAFTMSDSGVIFGMHWVWGQYGGYYLSRYIAGEQWEDLGSPLDLHSHYVAFQNAVAVDQNNRFYVPSGDQGLFTSSDYGSTWQLSLEKRGITAIVLGEDGKAIAGASSYEIASAPPVIMPGGVFVTSDGGNHWSELAGLDDKSISKLAVDSSGNVIATTTEGMFRFDVQSSQWTRVFDSEFPALLVTSRQSVLLSDLGASVYRSTDDGINWSSTAVRGRDVFSLFSPTAGTVFAGTIGDRVFSTISGGIGWQQLPPGSIGDYVYSFTGFGSTVYAGTNEGLFTSTDMGITWTNTSSQSFGGAVYAISVSEGGHIFVGTNFGVYASSDGGAAWQQLGLAELQILYLTRSTNGVLYAGTESNGVFVSTDDGQTWSDMGLDRNDAQAIGVSDAGTIFVGVFGGVIFSTDGGASWMPVSFTTRYVTSFAFGGTQTVFAGSGNGVWCSTDGGSTWATVGLSGQYVLALDLDDDGNLLAGAYRGGVWMATQAVPQAVEERSPDVPLSFSLSQNYPNPFNPTTNFQFSIANSQLVILKVYDILGKEVVTLVNEVKQPGTYTCQWNASDEPSGVYFYRLTAGDFSQTKKLVLMK